MHQCDSPDKTLRLATLPDTDSTGLHYLFTMRRNALREYLGNLDAKPSPQLLIEAADTLSEASQVSVSVELLEQMLALFPQMRIKLALAGSAQDTDVREDLCDTLAFFLLGCHWPRYGDDVDPEQFEALLKKQAFLLREGL